MPPTMTKALYSVLRNVDVEFGQIWEIPSSIQVGQKFPLYLTASNRNTTGITGIVWNVWDSSQSIVGNVTAVDHEKHFEFKASDDRFGVRTALVGGKSMGNHWGDNVFILPPRKDPAYEIDGLSKWMLKVWARCTRKIVDGASVSFKICAKCGHGAHGGTSFAWSVSNSTWMYWDV